MKTTSWVLKSPREPMVQQTREETPGSGEVLVEVAGCGVCHTDICFFDGDAPTRHPLPLTLGHEIAGRVREAGAGAESLAGRNVIIPAVLPCGECAACDSGLGSICPKQIFPGNDVHGGFGTHVRVPARGLCPVPDLGRRTDDIDLATLSVIADAVTTPYQAIRRSGLAEGDLAVFVGVGGVGGFGVQIAAALGAVVVALDVNDERLELATKHGATLALGPGRMTFKEMRAGVRDLAARSAIPTWRWKIYETSGTTAGQETAFGLLGHGAYLSVVGFTPGKPQIRLSNLMALHARAEGNWGCLPELYPEALALVLDGKVRLGDYVEKRPLSSINEIFRRIHEHAVSRRVILVPEH